MPSASHFPSAQPTIDTGEEITSSALKPPMSRTASGVARELVQGDMEKAVIKRMSQGSLRGLATSQSVQIPPIQGDQDPVSEAQVDEMVEKGRIEVGVVPDPPKLGLSASGNLGVPTQEELQAGGVEGEDEAEAESGAIAMGIAPTPVRSKSGRSVRSVAKSPSTILQKREPDDEAPYENEVVCIVTAHYYKAIKADIRPSTIRAARRAQRSDHFLDSRPSTSMAALIPRTSAL